MKHPIASFLKWIILLGLLAVSSGTLVLIGTVLYLTPNLPNAQQIREIQLAIPLRIYTLDEQLIAEFGEQRRTPIAYSDIPKPLVEAILSAEDDRFFSHHGVDLKGLARASFELVKTGRIKTGGSTITMQVAKNFFLTRERTFLRKFNEILLAIALERSFSKAEIFELYANKIYLGHRAYGFAAASHVYYGKPIPELNLAQLAMIAGLPKAPSRYNPITNPVRAKQRRDWILQRMLGLGKIDQANYQQALNEPVTAKFHGLKPEIEAGYAAEMVRQSMFERFGEDAYTQGFRVYTQLDARLQHAANTALQNGLLAYSKRHGYLGPEQRVLKFSPEPEAWLDRLEATRTIGPLQPAIVLQIFDEGDDTGSQIQNAENTQAENIQIAGDNTQGYARLGLSNGQFVNIHFEDMRWAREFISANRRGPAPTKVSDALSSGDLIRITKTSEGTWQLAQLPNVQGALVALDAMDGGVKALVGGFDFHQSKFNRVTQGGRQAGSSFKPFIYASALNKGLTAASLINDAPIVFEDQSLEQAWRPENSSGNFFGPTRLREALYKSRNLVSIRLLQQIGVNHTVDYLSGFGFPEAQLPKDLSLALGSATITPLQLAVGYTQLANGGYQVKPYLIDHIKTDDGTLIYKHKARVACAEHLISGPKLEAQCMNIERRAIRHMDPAEHFLIQDMLQDVIKRGTGRKARTLNRNDIAGKTGTTNDQRDAWFAGYHPKLVTTTWVGFDTPSTLGSREYGATAALPIWIDFMREALTQLPEIQVPVPESVISVRIDPKTGLRAHPGDPNALFEYFRIDNAPEDLAPIESRLPSENEDTTEPVLESLF